MVNSISANKEFYPTDHCGVLRLKTDKILLDYLVYALQVEGEYERFSRNYRASIQKVRQLIIQVPPIEEQEKIIEEIKKVDLVIEEQKSTIEKYDKDIKSKFIEMFEGKKFEFEKLSELFTFQLGKTPSRYNNEYWTKNGYKWISVADMGKYNRFTKDTTEFITDIAIADTGIKFVPANTVIMSFKLTIGRTAITSENIFTNEAIIAFLNKGKKYIHNEYLRLWLSLHDWSTGEMNAVKGVTLNQSSIGNTSLSVPPKELQDEFASYVEEIDKLKFEASERKKKADIEKENLIEKYFR